MRLGIGVDPRVTTPVLPLDEALSALEGAAAALGAARPEVRALLARHADFWRFRTGACADLSAWAAVYPLASLTPNGRALVLLLLEVAARCPAVEAVARAAGASAPDTVFGAPARALQRDLPAAELAVEPARREVLLRTFARACGAAVAPTADGPAETPAQSLSILARLDIRTLRAQDAALHRQMRLIEATREANALIASGKDLGP